MKRQRDEGYEALRLVLQRPQFQKVIDAIFFVLDMAVLTGLPRALSFIGLGVVLIGMGLFYQRLLFRSAPPAAAPPGQPAE